MLLLDIANDFVRASGLRLPVWYGKVCNTVSGPEVFGFNFKLKDLIDVRKLLRFHHYKQAYFSIYIPLEGYLIFFA